MPSFRQAKNQAAFAVKQHLAIGKSKHQAKTSDKIYSIGTARNYEQALTKLTHWLRENKRGDLQHLTEKTARQYTHRESKSGIFVAYNLKIFC